MKVNHQHTHQGSPLFPISRALSSGLNRLPSSSQGNVHAIHATYNLDLLRARSRLGWMDGELDGARQWSKILNTRIPLTSAINTHLGIRYSSILSTCPNHQNTFRSALLVNSLSIPLFYGPLQFLLYPLITLQKCFPNTSSQEHPLFFSQYFSYPILLLRTTPLVQLLFYLNSYSHLSPILYCLAHFSALSTLYTPFILRTTSLHILHQLPLATPCVLKRIYFLELLAI